MVAYLTLMSKWFYTYLHVTLQHLYWNLYALCGMHTTHKRIKKNTKNIDTRISSNIVHFCVYCVLGTRRCNMLISNISYTFVCLLYFLISNGVEAFSMSKFYLYIMWVLRKLLIYKRDSTKDSSWRLGTIAKFIRLVWWKQLCYTEQCC